MDLILTLFAIILVSILFYQVSRELKIPSSVCFILLGIVLTVGRLREIFVGDHIEIIRMMGDFALLCIMFLAGINSSWSVIYHERNDSAIIALFSAFFSFAFGFLVFYVLGFPLLSSLMIGICMSITAEATKADVLLELGKMKTRLGSVMIGSGILDDMFGLVLFVLVSFLAHTVNIWDNLIIVLSVVFFFLGLGVQKILRSKKRHERNLTKRFDVFFMLTIFPFFFISIASHFNVSIILDNLFVFFMIVIVAVAGKLIGTFLTKPFVPFSWKQLHLLGWSMNSRGAIELALALIALRNGFISSEVYAGLIGMALLTTLVFPFIMSFMVSNNKNIMR